MTGDTEPTRVSLGECDAAVVFAVVTAAVARARSYFRVPAEFESYVRNCPATGQTDDNPLMTFFLHGYLSHEIYIAFPGVDSYALAWAYAGHEVAHVQTREIARAFLNLPEHDDRLRADMREGIEATTTRLARMFLRDCPYPGDAEFVPAPEPALPSEIPGYAGAGRE